MLKRVFLSVAVVAAAAVMAMGLGAPRASAAMAIPGGVAKIATPGAAVTKAHARRRWHRHRRWHRRHWRRGVYFGVPRYYGRRYYGRRYYSRRHYRPYRRHWRRHGGGFGIYLRF